MKSKKHLRIFEGSEVVIGSLVRWIHGLVEFCVQKLFGVCLSRDGISLHIDEVEPVDGIIGGYGFAQQIMAFIVEKPKRTPTTGDLGSGSRSVFRDSP